MKEEFTAFLKRVENPLVVVSTIPQREKEAVVDFLIKLNAPVYLEAISGIREEPQLQHLRITSTHKLWTVSENAGYKIDGILRIGGVPTFRPWRDLEDKQNKISVFSLSHLPFSGLSWGNAAHVNISHFLRAIEISKAFNIDNAKEWLEQDEACYRLLHDLIEEEPLAEPCLLNHLSVSIPEKSIVYLGNSLPIREWDLAATYNDRNLDVFATRGLNGIDGQVSTFLGMATQKRGNWGIFGDLTMLYDLAGPWILNQLKNIHVNLVVINNSGGKIFSRMFSSEKFQNSHTLSMEHIAKHWGLAYYSGNKLPDTLTPSENRLIELIPDAASTDRFWEKYHKIPDLLRIQTL